jgi:hypothetical protein
LTTFLIKTVVVVIANYILPKSSQIVDYTFQTANRYSLLFKIVCNRS